MIVCVILGLENIVIFKSKLYSYNDIAPYMNKDRWVEFRCTLMILDG
jgi:hypothetical protein